MGKTFAGAVPLADMLDPTFEKEWEDRFIFADQNQKYATFLRKKDAETFAKAYIEDELAVGGFSEDHATKDVKRRVKTGELRRRKYAFVLAALTDIDKLTKGLRHQFDFIFEALTKNIGNKFTTYRVTQVQQVPRYDSYGEKFMVYNEIPLQLGKKYWDGTPTKAIIRASQN